MSRSDLPCFDELIKMNRQDPDKLEALRLRLTDELLRDKPPEQRRSLEQLAFRIEAERKRCQHPMGLCIRFSNMMHERFWNMAGLLQRLQSGPGIKELEAGIRGAVVTGGEIESKDEEKADKKDSTQQSASVVSLDEYRRQKQK
ncbi:DUF3135 domain-containing protein [Nitrincola sp. MINF-07-Sa-05]|uniref:DUF3135 domain-containing protein n=1 Tax=Nitrincola salilacus TaxID=3400273 RepID=UPI003918298F